MKKLLLCLLLTPFLSFSAGAEPKQKSLFPSQIALQCSFPECVSTFKGPGKDKYHESHMLDHFNIKALCPGCNNPHQSLTGLSCHFNSSSECKKKYNADAINVKKIMVNCPECKLSLPYIEAFDHLFNGPHTHEELSAIAANIIKDKKNCRKKRA